MKTHTYEKICLEINLKKFKQFCSMKLTENKEIRIDKRQIKTERGLEELCREGFLFLPCNN
jgi:hypothetical protein